MITPMKKVTIICLDSERKASLETLRSMGIMHVTPLKNPTGNALNSARNDMNRVQKVLETLPDVKKKAEGSSLNGEAVVEEVQKLLQVRKRAEDDISEASNGLMRYEVFGNLDPDSVRALESRGVFVRLYVSEAKKAFEVEDKEALVIPFGESGEGLCRAVINRGESPAKLSTPATVLPLPAHSISHYRTLKENAEKKLALVENRLSELAADKKKVQDCLKEASDAYTFEETSAGMLSSNLLAAIQGFCPALRVKELETTAKASGWALRVEDPTDEDNVPTLLTYSKVSRPMQMLYDIIGIAPGYHEVDVSSVFLVFFSIFFAMIVGDVAYGLLFLAITLYVRKKNPNSKSSGFSFMYLMCGATIVWGIFNGSFLGLKPEWAGWSYYLDFTNYAWLPEPVRHAMQWIRTSAPTDPQVFESYKAWVQDFKIFPESFVPGEAGASQMTHVQFFCFCLAVVHLTIAHVWNIIIRFKRKDSTFMAQVGWLLCCWFMFMLANNMVLGFALPGFAIPLFVVAAVLLVLFSVPPSRLKQDWISIPMLALNIVNSFTDVISYIRLFAVGMSGAAIAEAFNGMLSPLFGSFVGVFGAAVILLFVHGLNIALALMGVAVHAVRLNTLEFSNGLDLQWSGYAFSPFSKNKN